MRTLQSNRFYSWLALSFLTLRGFTLLSGSLKRIRTQSRKILYHQHEIVFRAVLFSTVFNVNYITVGLFCSLSPSDSFSSRFWSQFFRLSMYSSDDRHFNRISHRQNGFFFLWSLTMFTSILLWIMYFFSRSLSWFAQNDLPTQYFLGWLGCCCRCLFV